MESQGDGSVFPSHRLFRNSVVERGYNAHAVVWPGLNRLYLGNGLMGQRPVLIAYTLALALIVFGLSQIPGQSRSPDATLVRGERAVTATSTVVASKRFYEKTFLLRNRVVLASVIGRGERVEIRLKHLDTQAPAKGLEKSFRFDVGSAFSLPEWRVVPIGSGRWVGFAIRVETKGEHRLYLASMLFPGVRGQQNVVDSARIAHRSNGEFEILAVDGDVGLFAVVGNRSTGEYEETADNEFSRRMDAALVHDVCPWPVSAGEKGEATVIMTGKPWE